MPNPHLDLEQLTRELVAQIQPQSGHDKPRSQWGEEEQFDGRPKTRTIQVLVVRPNEAPELLTIPNELDAMQRLVGGTITTFDTGIDGVIGVANDEALLCQMPANRFVPASNNLIFGALFIAGDGVNFHSLSQGQLTEALTAFAPPLTREQVQKALRAPDEASDWIESEMNAGLDE